MIKRCTEYLYTCALDILLKLAMHFFGKFSLYAILLFDFILDSFLNLEDITFTSWLYFTSVIFMLYSVSSCSLDLKVMSLHLKYQKLTQNWKIASSEISSAIILLPTTIAGLLNKF